MTVKTARKPHFSGYATRANVKCTDGRTIKPDAFKHQDGTKVPLMWMHGHKDIDNVLGHAILENRPEGVYAYGYFNDSPRGKVAHAAVKNGDLDAMSIYANRLRESNLNVAHGNINEVSLVILGANPEALIDKATIAHASGLDEDEIEDALIYSGEQIAHGDDVEVPEEELLEDPAEKKEVDPAEPVDDPSAGKQTDPNNPEDPKVTKTVDNPVEHADKDGEKTLQSVYDTLNDEQLGMLHFMLQEASKGSLKQADSSTQTLIHQEGSTVNTFDQFSHAAPSGASLIHTEDGSVLDPEKHKQFVAAVCHDGVNNGSFKDALLAHAGEYGITNIEVLFPDAKAIDAKPEWITRRMDWVEGVLNGTRKLPFSRIKSLSADLTHEEARARGYIKADVKKEQFFSIQKRETGPKTIYKRQRLDRDDIIDITDFDIVAWLWVEMRFMLREEVARAILIGDGREIDNRDKIDEDKIRPIATDDEFYTDVIRVHNGIGGLDMVEAVLRGREPYEGSGEPTAYMTRSTMNDMLLVRDNDNKRMYRNRSELAQELEVSNIVLVPVMDGAKRDGNDIVMILVNMSDYSVGSTKGGEITTFQDFDLNVNQEQYLIEGRMSGALTKAKTAQVVVRVPGTAVTPTEPNFNESTGVLTIPTKQGVEYRNGDSGTVFKSGAQTPLNPGQTITVRAYAVDGHFLSATAQETFSYTRPAA